MAVCVFRPALKSRELGRRNLEGKPFEHRRKNSDTITGNEKKRISYMDGIWIDMIEDLWSVHLAIMGILVSVMTLLYATLSSKVEEMKCIKDSSDFTLMNRKTIVSNSIKALRLLNKKVMVALVGAFVLFVISSFLKYIECSYSGILVSIVAVFTLLLILGIAIIAYGVYAQYQKETN